MKLYKVNTIYVDGFEGTEIIEVSYMLSELESIKDEDEITADDVRDADELFLDYTRYENLGDITEDEIRVLTKFGMIK